MQTSLPSLLRQALDQFLDLHGDRAGADAPEICVGFAWLDEFRFVVAAPNAAAPDAAMDSVSPLSSPALRLLRRMFQLAERAHRPLLLWELESALRVPQGELGATTAWQQVVTQCLKRRIPLISAAKTPNLEFADHHLDISSIERPEPLREALRDLLRRCESQRG